MNSKSGRLLREPGVDEPVYGMRSYLEGILWPALPTQRGATLLSLLFQFEQTQWWPVERLLEHQLLQMETLLHHAWETVPFYRSRLDAAGYRPDAALSLADWRALPVLTRSDIQNAGETLASSRVPAQYRPTMETQTSGSTGQPVRVRTSELDALMWQAMTLREHLWHHRDVSRKLAVIRASVDGAGVPPHGILQMDWGPPTSIVFQTGPSAALSFAADVGTQAAWLKQHEPDYLLTYPTNLQALIGHFSAMGERPAKLREVRTVGETVTPGLRAACRDAWNVPITDTYSSQEFGYLALQCPQSGHYHVMGESVFVEILAADGRPCGPGEIGRLVVTALHNLAMPLIRYELRDFAEAGAPCACGRGLPAITRILGRSRNMLTLPGGGQRWPLVGFHHYRGIAPVRQYQFIQHTLENIEVRLVTDRPLTAVEEARLARVIQEALGHPFGLSFAYFDGEIPRTPGGKFEEFISKIVT
jgi:phenylacetate-CoA ligase